MPQTVKRFDQGTIARVRRLDDGSFVGEVVATRAGVFPYQMRDGSIRRELRPPEEVFHPESVASAKMRPITDRHPDEFVTPDNAQELGVGFTGEKVRSDGLLLVVPVSIATKRGIQAVADGRREVSFGYEARVDEESGTFEGEDYTHVQRGIRYNHLALVEKARAGSVASLRLDAADAVMVVKEESGKESQAMPESTKTESMQSIRLDNGLPYDVRSEVAVEFEAVRKQRNDAVSSKDELQKKFDALEAERDELKETVAKLEKVDHADAIKAGVEARLAIVAKAKKVLDEEAVKKLDSMSEDAIKVAIIKSAYPELELEGKSADYIEARCDAIVDAAEEKGDDAQAQANGDEILGGSRKKDEDDVAAAKTPEKKRDAAIAKLAKQSTSFPDQK
jgi:hypothetical protein